MKLSELPPIQRKGDLALVFGIVFTEDEIRAHPAYKKEVNRVKALKAHPLAATRPQMRSGTGTPIDNCLYGVTRALKSSARRVWKPSMFMRAVVNEEVCRAITFSHNASAEGMVLPPPETIERLKKALKTTKDPEWYYSLDDPLE